MRFTEPPSEDGTAGPQIEPEDAPADAAPPDEAVVFAVFDDTLGASPGSCRAASALVDDGALIDPDEPDKVAVPAADPVVAGGVEPLAGDPVVVVAPSIEDVVVADVAGALVELDVVLLPGDAVVVALLDGMLVEVTVLDGPASVPFAFPGTGVWACIAAAPNMNSAMVPPTADKHLPVVRMTG